MDSAGHSSQDLAVHFPRPYMAGALQMAAALQMASVCSRPQGQNASHYFPLGDHDAVSVTLCRNERCKATILAAATSAFDPVRELDRQLLRAITSRFLEERCEYEDNEHDGKHVQYHRCRSPGRQQSCFPLRMHPPSPS